MTCRTRRWGLIALTVVSLAACRDSGSDGSRVPTESQAKAILEKFVTAAKTAKTAREFCAASLPGDDCQDQVGWAGGDASIPKSTPTVVDSSRVVGDNIRVLVVCGTDGLGRSYESDFPVIHDSDHNTTFATQPVYWGGLGFSGEVPADEPQTAGAASPGSGAPSRC